MKQRGNSIILCGFKASGKSFLGRRLAKDLEREFCDTDDIFVERHGLSCPELYLSLGEKGFREAEFEVIQDLSSSLSDGALIASGGGTFLDERNWRLLKALGKIYYLEWNKSELKSRLKQQSVPAYFLDGSWEECFEKIYYERLPIYRSVADVVVKGEEAWEVIRLANISK